MYVKCATVVVGDLKGHFSIATTPRWKGGRYSFSFCWGGYYLSVGDVVGLF